MKKSDNFADKHRSQITLTKLKQRDHILSFIGNGLDAGIYNKVIKYIT